MKSFNGMPSFLIILFLSSTFLIHSQSFATTDVQDEVTTLVNEMVVNKERQERAFIEIEKMGDVAVPHIVGHLGDIRSLAFKEIRLENNFKAAFEKYRTYEVEMVNDALVALLNQMTGKYFGDSFDNKSQQHRLKIRRKWVAWCKNYHHANKCACETNKSRTMPVQPPTATIETNKSRTGKL